MRLQALSLANILSIRLPRWSRRLPLARQYNVTRGVLDGLFARPMARNAGLCSPICECFTKPFNFILSATEKPFGLGQPPHNGRRSCVVTDLPCGEAKADWTTAGSCYSMSLCVHATFGQAPSRDTSCGDTLPGSGSGVLAPPFYTAGWTL